MANKFSFQIWATTGICVVSSLISLGLIFTKEGVSISNLSARQKALANIANHVKSKSCWHETSDIPYKIGDPLITKGTQTGQIPTSCFIVTGIESGLVSDSKQYLEVAYKNSELQVIRIFSNQELQNQLSIKGEK